MNIAFLRDGSQDIVVVLCVGLDSRRNCSKRNRRGQRPRMERGVR
jgi:hypothetical protein